jgi:hypothetical protein
MPHMRLPVPLDAADAILPEQSHDHEHMHDMDSEYAGMGGMILGITVTGPSELDTETGWNAQRRLEMNVGNQDGDPRFYEISLKDLNSADKPETSTGLTGPLLVVTQGQQTEITVTNTSRERELLRRCAVVGRHRREENACGRARTSLPGKDDSAAARVVYVSNPLARRGPTDRRRAWADDRAGAGRDL